jgi:hypothetical protein
MTTPAKPGVMYVHHMTAQHSQPYPVYLFHVDPGADLQKAVERAVAKIDKHEVEYLEFDEDGNVDYRAYSYMVFVLQDSEEVLKSVEITNDAPAANKGFDESKRLRNFPRAYSACYCTNLRKDRSGNPLGAGEIEPFTWTVHHGAKSGRSPRGDRSHEGTGTNTGP